MTKVKAKEDLKTKLPDRLVNELYAIADKYRDQGVRLFIFGSFANATNRYNSDLDIGIVWDNERSKALYRQLRSDIWGLPTIRKIDLVDMAKAPSSLVRDTEKSRIYL